MRAVGVTIDVVLTIFVFILIARFVFDWVQVFARSWVPRGPMLVLLEVIYSVTDPPIRAVRRVLPPIRLGAMALDLSPMIVLVVVFVLRALNAAILL